MLRNLVYGNVIADFSNNTSLGGTLIISNSCKTSSLNNRASIAFAVADISYGTLKKGLLNNNIDSADARITAIIDKVSPTVGTGLSVSVSSNHANPPVEALRVQSNGNVGIGTQTPQFPLDVNGSARIGSVGGNLTIGRNNNSSAVGSIGGQLLFAGTAGDSATVNDGGTILNRIYENNTEKSELVLFKGNDSGSANGPDRIRLRAAALAFDTFPASTNSFTDENIRMFINKDGNVGIGTQTPQFPLDVNGNIRLGTGTTGNILFGTTGVGTTQAGYIDLINNTMTVMNQQNGNIIFGTNNGEDMRISSNGNIGIGTQTPQFPLDVNGIVRSTDVRIDNGNIHLGQSAGLTNQGTNAIAIGSNAGQTNQGPNSIAIGSNSSVTGTSSVAIGYNATTSTFTNSVALGTGATSTADNQIVLGTASQNVSILGNVGIGTQTPQVPLHVAGNVRINNGIINYTNSPMISYSRASIQSISNNVDVSAIFPDADPRNGTMTGISYNTGTGIFTNTNAYSVTLNVSVSIAFVASGSEHSRTVSINTSGQGRVVSSRGSLKHNELVLSTSATFVLNANETFNIIVNNGGGGNIGSTTLVSRVSVLVM